MVLKRKRRERKVGLGREREGTGREGEVALRVGEERCTVGDLELTSVRGTSIGNRATHRGEKLASDAARDETTSKAALPFEDVNRTRSVTRIEEDENDDAGRAKERAEDRLERAGESRLVASALNE